MNLQELMQARANIYDQQMAILSAAETEGRELTAEEEVKFQALETEYAEADQKVKEAEANEERANLMAQRGNELNGAQNKPFRPAAVAGAPVQTPKKDTAGFANLGEFIHDLRFGDSKGRLDKLPVGEGEGGGRKMPEAFASQVTSFRNELSMGGVDGAESFLPTQFRPDTVFQISPESPIVRPMAMVLPAGSPPDSKITLPALDQGDLGVYGGVQVTWIAEGDAKPETNAKLREITLEPHEVAATIVVTDKLLRNWEAATPFIRRLLTNAMIAAEDIAFLKGDGTGKPLGILNATGALAVNRSTANQIKYLDIVAMIAKLLPESMPSACWCASQSTLPQLMTLQDPGGRYIFIQGDATKGIPSTLAGIPIRFTGRTNALGTKGDLTLCDLSHYLIKDGSGPFVAASEHVLFRNNKTVIKCFWNVDGKPWVVEPLTLENGVTQVSPYVILDIPSA
ncbi:phage major capsid protein [Paenibacillus rhizophilus]|uniref:Phage major capsid protein n=1 Tax=Paenibacillus rhizophilus TaxID=1850366 RepID=A0A3N9P6L7_9BACL|nr:phage major capsid protein [Paenibacillus rhizophilus]RQW11838.1 phage major capsid protein [Paenibacillus rhizophilus]